MSKLRLYCQCFCVFPTLTSLYYTWATIMTMWAQVSGDNNPAQPLWMVDSGLMMHRQVVKWDASCTWPYVGQRLPGARSPAAFGCLCASVCVCRCALLNMQSGMGLCSTHSPHPWGIVQRQCAFLYVCVRTQICGCCTGGLTAGFWDVSCWHCHTSVLVVWTMSQL